MADVKRILDFYIRRNLRLRARGAKPISIRESSLAQKEFREDKVKIPKSKEEAQKRSRESAATEAKAESESAERIKKMVDFGDAEWKTINGVHVCIDKTGGIVAGPNHMVGKNVSEFEKKKESIHDIEIPKVTKNPDVLKAERKSRAYTSHEKIRETQKALNISPKGANASCEGFCEGDGEEEKKLTAHVYAHGEEPPFEKMTPDEYEQFAVNFLMQPCTDKVLGGAVVEDHGGIGVVAIIRYDKETGIFAKGYPGGYVKTCMVAKYNIDTPTRRVYNPNWRKDGYDYFLREMQKATWKPNEKE